MSSALPDLQITQLKSLVQMLGSIQMGPPLCMSYKTREIFGPSQPYIQRGVGHQRLGATGCLMQLLAKQLCPTAWRQGKRTPDQCCVDQHVQSLFKRCKVYHEGSHSNLLAVPRHESRRELSVPATRQTLPGTEVNAAASSGAS